MKYYIAAPLEYYKKVLEFEDLLKIRGDEVTYSWATDYHKQLYEGLGDAGSKAQGDKCIQGVKDADIVALYMTKKTRGCHIEYGIALGAGKKVIVYCEHPHDEISMYKNVYYTVPSFEKALMEL